MKYLKLLGSVSLLITGAVFAQAPVIDMSQQRDELRILKQQVDNFTQLDLPGKIDTLQQQMQALNGRLEVQTHQVEALVEQQKSFYQDFNQRLQNLQTNGSAGNSAKISSGIVQAQENISGGVSPTSVPAQPAVAGGAAATPEAEEKAYQAAFGLLTKKQNTEAIAAFNAFLTTYPTGKRAATVHYWLGELYSSGKQNSLAVKHLNVLISRYPNNDKVPDAMLKLAIIDDESGQKEKAQKAYKTIVQQYPHSGAARLATMRLQRK